MSQPNTVIFDCDPGVDDIVALGLQSLRQPSIAAVVTSYGCASIGKTTRNARRFLDLLGRQGVPVIQGASRPSIWPHPFNGSTPPTFFGRNGINNVRLPASGAPGMIAAPGDDVFVEHLAELLRASDSVDYYLTGPCTNLARVCRRYPDLVKEKLARLTIMGGALGSGNSGTVNPATSVGVSEFNFYLDPVAVDLVLSLELQPRLVTWDQTKKFRLYRSAALRLRSQSMAAQALLRMLTNFFRLYAHDTVTDDEKGNEPYVILSDPLVLFTKHDSCRLVDKRIKIVTHGDQFGRTVESPDGHPVKYFELLDPASAMDYLLSALGIYAAG